MLKVLYLDNYYYYAPVPRVLRLRELYKDTFSGISRLIVQRKLLKGEFVVAKIAGLYTNSVVRRVLGYKGRHRSKRLLNIANLARASDLGEETTLLLEFIVFYARHEDPNEIEKKLEAFECPAGDRIEIGRETAKAALRLLRNPERLVDQPNILRFVRLYAICRVAKLLGFERPELVEYIELYRISPHTVTTVYDALEACQESCGHKKGKTEHIEDLESVERLIEYSRAKRYVVLVATLASIGARSVEEECFACLIDRVSRNPGLGITHLVPT